MAQWLFSIAMLIQLLISRGDLLMIPKEDLHYLVEQVREDYTQMVYKLQRLLIEKDSQEGLDVKVDFLTLSESEKHN